MPERLREKGTERKEQRKLDQWEYRDRGGQQGGEGSKANKSAWLEGSQTDQLPPPAADKTQRQRNEWW